MPAELQAPLAVAQHLLEAPSKAPEPSGAPEEQKENGVAPCDLKEEAAENVSSLLGALAARPHCWRMVRCWMRQSGPGSAIEMDSPEGQLCRLDDPSGPAPVASNGADESVDLLGLCWRQLSMCISVTDMLHALRCLETAFALFIRVPIRPRQRCHRPRAIRRRARRAGSCGS